MCSSVDIVYNSIKNRILESQYLPNEVLVESTIAKELNVSRSTVKKAMLKLENDYLVKIENNKSTTVRSVTKEEALYLLEIRERIEGLIAYKVAELDNIAEYPEMIEVMKMIDEMKKVLECGNLSEHSDINDSIHSVLYSLCPNREAIRLLDQINLQLRRYNKRTILISGRQENSYKEHEAIIEAVINGDKDGAEEAMRTHIRNIRKTIEDNYEVLFM